MQIDRRLLESAAEKGIINGLQVDKLWNFLKEQSEDIPSFNFTHILYYLGGLIAIGAMSLFMTLGWEIFGGFGILFLSLVYGGFGIYLTNILFSKKYMIPAGITAAFVIALTPLAIYGLQKGIGWWPDNPSAYRDYHRLVEGMWIMMELGTLIVASIIFYFYKRPFLLLPVAITLWYMSMDLTPFLFSNLPDTWKLSQLISLYVGIMMILLAFWIDIRSTSKLDYAFHLYLFGTLAFWGALTSMHSDSELGKLGYCGINLFLICIGAVLSRRVFVVFGALGVTFYLGYVSYNLFKDSYLFPVLLSFLGFGIIYVGILWSRHGDAIGQKFRSHLPIPLQKLLARRQNS
jgi:hypothetical protein